MGLRFRKSKKFGPVRITLSKTGISSSVGVKGFRVTKTASGRVRTTASIPGTGISYVKEHKTEKTPVQGTKRAPDQPSAVKKKSSIPTIGIVVLILVILFGAVKSEESKETPAGLPQADAASPAGLDGLIEACVNSAEIDFPEHFEHKWLSNSKTLMFDIWIDDCNTIAEDAKAGYKEAQDKWKALLQDFSETAFAWQKNFDDAGYNVMVDVRLISPVDHRETLALFRSGKLTYDYSGWFIVSSLAPSGANIKTDEQSRSASPESTPEPTSTPAPVFTYVANTNTGKFHNPGCKSVSKIKDSNKWVVETTRENLIAMGYSPCGNCHP